MVDLEGLLAVVDGDPPLAEQQPGVVDEHVQRVELVDQLLRSGPHRVEVRVVAGDDVQVRVAGRGGDALARLCAPFRAAAQQRDGRAAPRERQRGLVAEA